MNKKQAVLAGGCFWGLEDLIRKLPGVIHTQVGYAGGSNQNPTYKNHPGHAEAVQITYDADQTDFRNILDFFFQIHDPTTMNRQGNDRGSSYRSAIFYGTQDEKRIAEDMIDRVNKSARWKHPVVTTLEALTMFFPAEQEHQNYLIKHPGGYTCHFIRGGSYLE
jgi:peptide-methionine (S)-S-oxide reductase